MQEQASSTPRTCSTPASVKGSPDITRYGKAWGLPPLQLSSVHLHSPVLDARNELDESVGSISGGNADDESQESGLYSPSTSSSPSRDAARRVVGVAGAVEVEDYYDGPLSRKSSFGKKDALRRDGSGRRDAGSSGRREDHELGTKKESFDKETPFELRHGAYTGSGRFDPYYNAHSAQGGRRNSQTPELRHDDELVSSATELSADSCDEASSAEGKSEDDEDHVPLPHRSAVKPPQRVGYPHIEGYHPPLVSTSPFSPIPIPITPRITHNVHSSQEREHRHVQRVEVQSPAAVQRRVATPTQV
jgi:hypothetical protein